MMFLVTDNNPLLPISSGTVLTQPTRGYFIALPVADVTDSTATIETTFTYAGEYDGVSEETLQIKHVHTIGDYHYYSVPWKMLSKITSGPSQPTIFTFVTEQSAVDSTISQEIPAPESMVVISGDYNYLPSLESYTIEPNKTLCIYFGYDVSDEPYVSEFVLIDSDTDQIVQRRTVTTKNPSGELSPPGEWQGDGMAYELDGCLETNSQGFVDPTDSMASPVKNLKVVALWKKREPVAPDVQANLYLATAGKTPGTYSSMSVAAERLTGLVAPYSYTNIHHPYHPNALTKKYLIGFKEMNDEQYISRLQLGKRRSDLINEIAHESNDPVFEQVADVSTYQYFNDQTVSGDSNFADVTTGVSFDLSIKENGYWDLSWSNGDPWDGVSDMYLVVNFVDRTKININTVGVGTVTGPGRTNTPGGNDTALPGEIVTITTTPADGYVLGTVTIKDANNNNIPSTDVDQNTKTFTVPENGDVDVTVIFTSDQPEQPYEGVPISLDKDYVLVITDVADGKSWAGPVHRNRWGPSGGDIEDAGLTHVTGSHGSLTWLRDTAIWTQMILNVSLTNGGRTGMVYSRSAGELDPGAVTNLAKVGVHSGLDRVFFSRITPLNSDPSANLPEGIGQDFYLQDIQFQFQILKDITGFTGTLYEVDPTSPYGDPSTVVVATCTWNNQSTGSSLEWAGPDTTSWEPADNLAGLLE